MSVRGSLSRSQFHSILSGHLVSDHILVLVLGEGLVGSVPLVSHMLLHNLVVRVVLRGWLLFHVSMSLFVLSIQVNSINN